MRHAEEEQNGGKYLNTVQFQKHLTVCLFFSQIKPTHLIFHDMYLHGTVYCIHTIINSWYMRKRWLPVVLLGSLPEYWATCSRFQTMVDNCKSEREKQINGKVWTHFIIFYDKQTGCVESKLITCCIWKYDKCRDTQSPENFFPVCVATPSLSMPINNCIICSTIQIQRALSLLGIALQHHCVCAPAIVSDLFLKDQMHPGHW